MQFFFHGRVAWANPVASNDQHLARNVPEPRLNRAYRKLKWCCRFGTAVVAVGFGTAVVAVGFGTAVEFNASHKKLTGARSTRSERAMLW